MRIVPAIVGTIPSSAEAAETAALVDVELEVRRGARGDVDGAVVVEAGIVQDAPKRHPVQVADSVELGGGQVADEQSAADGADAERIDSSQAKAATATGVAEPTSRARRATSRPKATPRAPS